jgi:hypothetical protein
MSVLAGVVTRAVAAAAAAGGAEGDMGKARREAGFCGGVLASWRAVARDFGAALVVSERGWGLWWVWLYRVLDNVGVVDGAHFLFDIAPLRDAGIIF